MAGEANVEIPGIFCNGEPGNGGVKQKIDEKKRKLNKIRKKKKRKSGQLKIVYINWYDIS
jgi:hypothetical protein